MEKINNKISYLQFATISYFLLGSLFMGVGIPNIFSLSKQDSWLVSIFSSIISIIPLLILLFIINYKPDKNIFEKITYLFGKLLGNIINFILVIFMFLIFIIVIKSTTSFATTMYLTKTPSLYIGGIFITIAIYAVIKGIETIGRMSEILFFISLITISLIFLGLYPIFHFYELKPILSKGFTPIFTTSFKYIAYCLTPLILITVIPKNNITNKKKYHIYFWASMFWGLTYLFHVFFLIPGVISAKLAELYRFPAYYVLRKISIGGVIDNVENFTSIHWYFDNFIFIVMCLYFFNRYIKSTFKIKKEKTLNLFIIFIGLISVYIANLFMKNPMTITKFMNKYFPIYVFLPILIILLIITLLIVIKNNRETI